MAETMSAPWIEFPELPYGSLGWRMGGGEGYLDRFLEWFYQLDQAGLDCFFEQYPPPDEWASFFEYHLEKMKTGKKHWDA